MSQIAIGTGVPKTTISRWLKLPSVQEEVEKFRQEIEAAHHKANQQSANKEATELQANLRASMQRQLKWSGEVQRAGHNLLTKVNEWVEEIDTVVKSRELTDEKKMDIRALLLLKLVPLLPSYARAAADMTRAGSETEDKIFALEEISKRLDEWNEVMGGNADEARQLVASEQ